MRDVFWTIAAIALGLPRHSISELTTDVDDYIEFYNHRRFHQTLDYKKSINLYQKGIKLNQNKERAS